MLVIRGHCSVYLHEIYISSARHADVHKPKKEKKNHEPNTVFSFPTSSLLCCQPSSLT
ncbi:hypothetical protein VCR4J5_200254 [Vibrio crassostreae]|uniref:Uncharacterized protein n=1 Tax=Vibrio crassostreae TaxID=246167 RepID=A0A822MW78_9VIBR|nr:hypothetical protein VCR9J2_1350202 [Vibrio crassostreae]CDT34585.1 hypothetical protein VCR4J5_200254 [Vibrio crassostreae]CDT40722.1 hypothetical protein VCR5J5_290082 [Vibrio crassostreae]CDT50338.1 hypothetical protein VCR19J5_560204 [Vibrio crassostreae]